MTTAEQRRGFLKAGLLGGAAAAAPLGAAVAAPATAPATAPAAAPSAPAGWQFFRPSEAEFAEHLADHMVPADDLSPSGTALGIPVYIDRALAGAWGQGERLYLQGPFAPGTPNQGYQLPLTPAQLFRAGFESLDDALRRRHGRAFAQLDAAAKEAVLQALQAGQLPLAVPTATWWAHTYQLVMEGLFADPVHGGNRDKAGWRLVGFPGVVQTHRRNIVAFRGKPFPHQPLGIADLA